MSSKQRRDFAKSPQKEKDRLSLSMVVGVGSRADMERLLAKIYGSDNSMHNTATA